MSAGKKCGFTAKTLFSEKIHHAGSAKAGKTSCDLVEEGVTETVLLGFCLVLTPQTPETSNWPEIFANFEMDV